MQSQDSSEGLWPYDLNRCASCRRHPRRSLDCPVVIRLLLALLAFYSCATASAQEVTYPTTKSAVIMSRKLDGMSALRAIELAHGNAIVLDRHNVAVGNAKVDVMNRRSITPRDLGLAAGRVAGAALKVGAIAAVAVAVNEEACRLTGVGIDCDPLQNPGTIAGYRMEWNGQVFEGTNIAEVTRQYAAARHKSDTPCTSSGCTYSTRTEHTYTGHTGAVASYSFRQNVYDVYLPTPGTVLRHSTVLTGSASFTTVNVNSCPAVPGLAGYEVAGGRMIDGKCPTGEMVPATDTQLEERIGRALSNNLRVVVEGLLSDGKDLTKYFKPMQATGPATVSEAPKTTTITSPSGTPQTKTETTNHAITYNNTGLTWVTNTTINNYDGTTEVIGDKEELSDCAKNPDSLACAELDTPPAPDLEQQDLDVNVTPDAGWGSDSAACPPPVTVTVLGQPVVIDNTLYCDFFTGIRPAVIAVFALAGALIFVGGLRQ